MDISELRCRAEDRLRKRQPGEQGLSLSPGDMHRIIHELSVHQIEWMPYK